MHHPHATYSKLNYVKCNHRNIYTYQHKNIIILHSKQKQMELCYKKKKRYKLFFLSDPQFALWSQIQVQSFYLHRSATIHNLIHSFLNANIFLTGSTLFKFQTILLVQQYAKLLLQPELIRQMILKMKQETVKKSMTDFRDDQCLTD